MVPFHPQRQSAMKPFEYLHLQMELEGIKRVSSNLITRTSQNIGDFPLVIIAQTSDEENLIYFDELIAEEIRYELSSNLQAFNMEKAVEVFEKSGIQTKAGHFKTYSFPEGLASENTEAVKCYSQDDPKIITFGFNGHAEKVFAIESEGVILSACVSSRQNSKSAEAWVFTHPEYRRKGLAQQVVTAWAENIQQEGLIPFYSHDVQNINSALLAKRLNLIQVFEESVLEKVS